ncbi:MAG TPA: S8 family serine peptidase, partial [Thermoanaerobaculia bacterium]|nr:S8 family serine peptidase [Thermoanaerobaculia bacterium]
MKRVVVVVLPLLASALFAQWAPHRIEKSDIDVLVEFRDPPLALVQHASAKTAVAQYDATFRQFRADLKTSVNIRHQYYELFNGVAITVSHAQIDDIRKLPYVKSVQVDLPVYALATPAPPANVVKIRADQVWSKFGTRGAGVTVAVIDTGIDYTHPALGGCFGPGCKVIGGYDFVNNDNDPRDDNLHGTHVAGIIAGNSDQLLGVAPDASLLAYKVLSASGAGSTSDVLAGIERAADPNNDGDFSDHADVANLSLGGLGNPDDVLSTAIDRGTSLGVVYCIAAGNAGSGYHTVASPGTARTAITVGATDVNDLLASFSSRGPNTKDAALKPDVLAPGVSIISSLPGGKYGALSGTSMATPHVAGVAALVKAVHHDWTAAQIKSAIVGTGNILGLDFMAQGGGRVDALSAASATALVSPASISLGEDHLPQTTFSPTTTLQITNVGSQPATFTIGASPGIGITVAANPSRVKIDAGATAPVTISYTITNGQVTPGAASLSFGNTIAITSDASDSIT